MAADHLSHLPVIFNIVFQWNKDNRKCFGTQNTGATDYIVPTFLQKVTLPKIHAPNVQYISITVMTHIDTEGPLNRPRFLFGNNILHLPFYDSVCLCKYVCTYKLN